MIAPHLLDSRPFSRVGLGISRSPAAEGLPVLFWNGSDVEVRPFSFRGRMLQELEWMADRLASLDPFPKTVIDIGGGFGCFTLLAAQRFPETTFVNLEINPKTLEAFATEAAALGNARALLGSLLDRSTWQQVETLPRPIAIHTCASIYWLRRDQLETLFRTMRKSGVTQGLHWEFQGWRTETGRALEARFPELVYHKPRLELETDPYDVARELGFEITERVEVPPHFLGQHLPSYFAWRVK